LPHHTPLIGTLVIAIVLAFILGTAANWLRISPLVGYVLAGVPVGPFTRATSRIGRSPPISPRSASSS
jgi:monovalent cation:H+ antiporter-2, CPA2 family